MKKYTHRIHLTTLIFILSLTLPITGCEKNEITNTDNIPEVSKETDVDENKVYAVPVDIRDTNENYVIYDGPAFVNNTWGWAENNFLIEIAPSADMVGFIDEETANYLDDNYNNQEKRREFYKEYYFNKQIELRLYDYRFIFDKENEDKLLDDIIALSFEEHSLSEQYIWESITAGGAYGDPVVPFKITNDDIEKAETDEGPYFNLKPTNYIGTLSNIIIYYSELDGQKYITHIKAVPFTYCKKTVREILENNPVYQDNPDYFAANFNYHTLDNSTTEQDIFFMKWINYIMHPKMVVKYDTDSRAFSYFITDDDYYICYDLNFAGFCENFNKNYSEHDFDSIDLNKELTFVLVPLSVNIMSHYYESTDHSLNIPLDLNEEHWGSLVYIENEEILENNSLFVNAYTRE